MIAKTSSFLLWLLTITQAVMPAVAFAKPAAKPAPEATPTNVLSPSEEEAITKEVTALLEKGPAEGVANIEFNFENADLQTLLNYIAELFDISFIPDDSIAPMLQGGKGVAGNKVTFRTNRPMTKKGVWALFTSFLDVAGLALALTPEKRTYRLTGAPAAQKMALQTFIGVDSETLPEDDMRIRYVYFLKNASVDSIKPIVEQLRGTTSSFTAFIPLQAIIITDKSYNIRALMKIVRELDKASPPEVMSVIKLKNTGAEDVKKLYDALTQGEDQRNMVARIFGARRQAESFIFPEGTRVISEPRTNALIVLGVKDAVDKIEDFVRKVDTEIVEETSPFYIYELQHTDALTMADIMNKVTQYGIGTVAGQAGGVREGEKYFKPITFTPEKSGNRLIVRGDYEDYIKAKEVIEKLDVMQPQIGLEVLVVTVDNTQNRQLGTAMRNQRPDTLANNVNFQSTFFNTAPVINPTTGSIMADLIGLATSAAQGSFLLSLGADTNIWAIFQCLSKYTASTIVSNPFLVTANKYKATVSLGQTRRVLTSTVTSGGATTQGQDDLSANLEVVIIPQINSDGLITLEISVHDDQFTSPVTALPAIANTTRRVVDTKAIVADKEVLALGGLIQTQVDEAGNTIPLLGQIPIIGWLFKSKSKAAITSNLLIFISPHIIQPKIGGGSNNYTLRKSEYARRTARQMEYPEESRDPVYRWFFRGEKPDQEINDFISRKHFATVEDMSNFYENRTTVEKPVYQRAAGARAEFQEQKLIKRAKKNRSHLIADAELAKDSAALKLADAGTAARPEPGPSIHFAAQNTQGDRLVGKRSVLDFFDEGAQTKLPQAGPVILSSKDHMPERKGIA